MTFELYHTRHSTCSQKVRLTLAEKGLPERGTAWVEHEVDLGKVEHLAPGGFDVEDTVSARGEKGRILTMTRC